MIAREIAAPHITAGGVYEVDELKTFVRCKQEHIWIAYALDRKDKSVACFSVGPRTNETLSKVTDKLNNARLIYTDKLRQYKTLISPEIHRTAHRGTNHIERHNLTIRTHIKRLTRCTNDLLQPESDNALCGYRKSYRTKLPHGPVFSLLPVQTASLRLFPTVSFRVKSNKIRIIRLFIR